MDIFETMSNRIVKAQELVIGPIAWTEAKKVSGLKIKEGVSGLTLTNGDPKVVDRLVGRYEKLFGRASVEVCKNAVRDIIGELPGEQVPSSLK